MNVRRNVTIALAAGAGAVWFANAMTPPVPSRDIPSAPPAIDRTGAAMKQEIDRLHDRLRPDASPRTTVRNPFAFHRSLGGAARLSLAPAAVVAPTAMPQSAFEPPLTLAGLAEDAGPGGEIQRTAIVSGAGLVFLVREGDSLTVDGASYVVAAVAATTVELRNTADGTTRRLSLP